MLVSWSAPQVGATSSWANDTDQNCSQSPSPGSLVTLFNTNSFTRVFYKYACNKKGYKPKTKPSPVLLIQWLWLWWYQPSEKGINSITKLTNFKHHNIGFIRWPIFSICFCLDSIFYSSHFTVTFSCFEVTTLNTLQNFCN